MAKTTQSKAAPATPSRSQRPRRTEALKQGLLDRQLALRNDVDSRMRDRRARRTQEGTDDLEHSEADIQNDLSLAVLQMQAETLVRIDAALDRLNTGRYGRCVECEDDIAIQRLQALPFAVRCQACEGKREQTRDAAQRVAHGRGRLAGFADLPRA
jgi:DnaK suppressor protein